MDYGLGIGYNPDSNASSQSVPSRSAAVNSLRTGMMAQFKSNFVAASSNSQSQGLSNSTSASAHKRPALPGFVSGGSIGGDIHRTQTTTSVGLAPPPAANTFSQNSGNANQNNLERLVLCL